MDNDIEQQKTPGNGKALAGIILLVVGGVLLLKQFDFFFFPHWLFSFPMVLIFLGLFIGARTNFHKPSSFVLLVLGIVLLINDNVNDAHDFIWPLAIIAVGVWLIMRRRNSFDKDQWKQANQHKWDWRHHANVNPNQPPVSDSAYTEVPPGGPSPYPPTGDDYLDAVSVFGGVKKTILSKDFKGGDIVNIFGGAELDLTQADISGRIIIDITQIFGGTKIIVPSNWQVVSDIAAVFASVDDKRMKTGAPLNSNKILVLKGVSIFAGIDIRSY
jgi:predicted membrane protein